MVGWDREKGLEPMEPWADWDPVMQEDYLAEIDLTVGDQLVLELRRKVIDTTKKHPKDTSITH